jgi:hypothetical protein
VKTYEKSLKCHNNTENASLKYLKTTKSCRKHCKKVNKLGKVKCAFAAEHYVPEKMESF